MSSWLTEGLTVALSKMFLTKGARFVIKIFGGLGLALGTHALVMQPLIDWAIAKWQSMPGSIAQWLSALGVDVAVSIILSAYGIQGATRVILKRKEP